MCCELVAVHTGWHPRAEVCAAPGRLAVSTEQRGEDQEELWTGRPGGRPPGGTHTKGKLVKEIQARSELDSALLARKSTLLQGITSIRRLVAHPYQVVCDGLVQTTGDHIEEIVEQKRRRPGGG